jgi:hypothetical protein
MLRPLFSNMHVSSSSYSGEPSMLRPLFSNILYMVVLHGKCTWALTFEDLCQILAETRRTGVAPYEDKFLKFQTTGYSGTLGGMEPLYIVRTGLCNIKGLMNSMPFDQVQALD